MRNVEKYGTARHITDDNTIRRMRIACWITRTIDTNTFKICNTYCFSTVTIVTRTLLNVTFIRTMSCLVNYYLFPSTQTVNQNNTRVRKVLLA
jgi:hypothetical protein